LVHQKIFPLQLVKPNTKERVNYSMDTRSGLYLVNGKFQTPLDPVTGQVSPMNSASVYLTADVIPLPSKE
jgi:hypothetical protein